MSGAKAVMDKRESREWPRVGGLEATPPSLPLHHCSPGERPVRRGRRLEARALCLALRSNRRPNDVLSRSRYLEGSESDVGVEEVGRFHDFGTGCT